MVEPEWSIANKDPGTTLAPESVSEVSSNHRMLFKALRAGIR